MSGVIHWVEEVSDEWGSILGELTRAFEMSRRAAIAADSFVYVVRNDDLLGRRGSGNAVVAAGLLSAARTAALEGSRKAWTANVLAFDEDVDRETVESWARTLLESGAVTGELVRFGPGHIGKALP